MDIMDSILLGIVQGLTEFLPVSSSGHLELGKAILGDRSIPEESLLFTVVLHFATALSTIVVFRKDVWILLKGLFSFRWNEDTRYIAKIALSMLPLSAAGQTTAVDLLRQGMEASFGAETVLAEELLSLQTGVVLEPGDIIVVDINSPGTVIHVDPATRVQTPIATLDSPVGVVVDADHQLYVTRGLFGNPPASVVRIDPESGAQTVVSSGGFLVGPIDIEIAPIIADQLKPGNVRLLSGPILSGYRAAVNPGKSCK